MTKRKNLRKPLRWMPRWMILILFILAGVPIYIVMGFFHGLKDAFEEMAEIKSIR